MSAPIPGQLYFSPQKIRKAIGFFLHTSPACRDYKSAEWKWHTLEKDEYFTCLSAMYDQTGLTNNVISVQLFSHSRNRNVWMRASDFEAHLRLVDGG